MAYTQRGNYITTKTEKNDEGKITKITLVLTNDLITPDENGCGIYKPRVLRGNGYTGESYPFTYLYYLYSCDIDDFTKDCDLKGSFPGQYVPIEFEWDKDKYDEGVLKTWTIGRNMPSFMVDSDVKCVSATYSITDHQEIKSYCTTFGDYSSFKSEAITKLEWDGETGTSIEQIDGFTSSKGTTCIAGNPTDYTAKYSINNATTQTLGGNCSHNRFAIYQYENKMYLYGISVTWNAGAIDVINMMPNIAGVFLEDKAGHLLTLTSGNAALGLNTGYNSCAVYSGEIDVDRRMTYNLPSSNSLGEWKGQLPIVSLNSSAGITVGTILPQSVASLFKAKGIPDGSRDTSEDDTPDPDTPDDDTDGGEPDDEGDGDDPDDGDTDPRPIVPPDITGTGTGAGFCLHKVTADQLQSVIQKIFSTGDGSFISTAKTFFGMGDNPFHYTPSELMSLILSCHCIPIASPSGSGSSEIWCGFYDTGITDTKRIDLWQNFTYGSVTVTKPTGTFIDTAGYRRIFIHVPFCGVFELDPSEVYGKTLTLEGRMNALTGQMMVTLAVGGKIMYTYTGCACIPIPLTAEDCSGTQRALLSAGVSVIAGVATGAVGGAIAGAGIAASGAVSGATAASVSGAVVTNQFSTASGMASTIGNGINSMVQNTTQAPAVAHSGGLGGGASAMDLQQAYLIIENRKYVSRGSTYISTLGLPSGKACTLSQLGSGAYAECSAVNLGLSGATSEEVNLAKKLLIQGVIV